MREVYFMSNKQPVDAYGKLKRILLVLFILTVVTTVGFFLVKGYVDQKVIDRQLEINKQNEELTAQYEQRVFEQSQKQEKGENIQWPTAKSTGVDILDVSNFALNGTRTQNFARQDLIASGMMLVNRWHTLPNDFSADDMVSIGRTYKDIQVQDNYVVIKKNVLEALKTMLDAAKAEGIEKFLIEEGYRTNEKQTEYFDKEAARWSDKFTGQTLVEKARLSVNVPGTSEYQTGLSFRLRRYDKEDADFNSKRFEETEHMTWLLEKGYQYGFIFRFPSQNYPTPTTTDKSWKTGEDKALRIMRYVGEAPAFIMHHMDFCLEEFVEYMIEHPHIAVYQEGELKYELIRVPDTGTDATLEVVDRAKSVQASIDNMGGIIVAMSY